MSKDDEQYLDFLRYQEVTSSNFVASPKKTTNGKVKRVVKKAERELKREAKKHGRR